MNCRCLRTDSYKKIFGCKKNKGNDKYKLKLGTVMTYTGSYMGRVVSVGTEYLLHMADTCRHVLGGDTC